MRSGREFLPDDVIFVDFQTSFLLRFYLCPEISFTGLPPADFRTYSCGGHRVISLSSETNVLTANLFPRRWDEMVQRLRLETRPDGLDISGRMGHWTGA